MSEDFPIYDSSPEMSAPAHPGNNKYPWKTLIPGRSFVVGKDKATLATLQSLAFRHGKSLGRKFRVIERENHFEVGCLALGNTPGVFSTALDPRVAQRVETPMGNAPIGWPVLKKEGEG